MKYNLEKNTFQGELLEIKRDGDNLCCPHKGDACDSQCPNFDIVKIYTGKKKKLEAFVEISCGCVVKQYKIENPEILED